MCLKSDSHRVKEYEECNGKDSTTRPKLALEGVMWMFKCAAGSLLADVGLFRGGGR